VPTVTPEVHDAEPGRIRVWMPEDGAVGQIESRLQVRTLREEWTSAGPIRVHAPEPLRVEPESVAVGDVITIHGRFMGLDRKGKLPRSVQIGREAAEVLTWAPERITARVREGSPGGVFGISVVEGTLAAAASQGSHCLAMLVRDEGETLMDMLSRLDTAIEDALERDTYVDEING